jgi:fermentation-respiration switch protein FrsA (DUF1100 family)
MKRLKRFLYTFISGGLLTALALWYVISDCMVEALLSKDKSIAVASYTSIAAEAASLIENSERWEFTAQDSVRLAAAVCRQEKDSRLWAIIIHGYSSCKEDMNAYLKAYYLRGYNVLLPDLRCHGESGGELTGMGWIDRLDIIGWTHKILKEDSNAEVVLHGVSMGAATALMSSGEKLSNNVKAIISDCAFTGVWDVFQWQISKNFLKHNAALLYGGSLVTYLKAGYSWQEASALNQVKKSRTPTLFIHGSADPVVPVSMAYELYNAASCKKKLMIVEGAKHAGCLNTDRDKYWLEVFNFINEELEDNIKAQASA